MYQVKFSEHAVKELKNWINLQPVSLKTGFLRILLIQQTQECTVKLLPEISKEYGATELEIIGSLLKSMMIS